MKKLKYAVEIEIAENLYSLMDAASHYQNGSITVPEALRQIVEAALTEDIVDPSEFKAVVTYIEQEEQ